MLVLLSNIVIIEFNKFLFFISPVSKSIAKEGHAIPKAVLYPVCSCKLSAIGPAYCNFNIGNSIFGALVKGSLVNGLINFSL